MAIANRAKRAIFKPLGVFAESAKLKITRQRNIQNWQLKKKNNYKTKSSSYERRRKRKGCLTVLLAIAETLQQMKNLKIKIDPRVETKFKSYPEEIRKKLDFLRNLILKVASENDLVQEIEETLKWGEPSYLTKHGSTLRMDWKEKSPGQYAMYFKCTSKLVATFKTIYKDKFNFENNRAIIFKLDDSIPETELKQCIRLALIYHKVKHLPLLGA